MVKTTAVLTDSITSFILWCKDRRIDVVRGNFVKGVDFENEIYEPIIYEQNIRGRYFNDVEETDTAEFNINYKQLKELIKQRIR